MTPVVLAAFASELSKLGGLATGPQEQKKETPGFVSTVGSSAKKNFGWGTALAGAGALALAAKNPAAAAKYLRQGKDMVAKPLRSLARGARSGRVDIKPGMAGASESASKRVGMYKDTFRDALGGDLRQHDVLTKADPGFLRKQNILSVGTRKAEGLKLDDALKKRVADVQSQLENGRRLPEKQLRALYDEIGQAGAAQKLAPKAGITTYLPGERALEGGSAVGGGLLEGAASEDPETGRKRGVGERLARGATGAAVGLGSAHMFFGRGAGLSARNLVGAKGLTGWKKKWLPEVGARGMLSQKGLLPFAAAPAILGGAAVATDAAGHGGRLVDRVFGQGE